MKLGRILMTVAMLALGAWGCGGGDEAETESAVPEEQAQGGEEAPMEETAPMDAPAEGTGTEPAPAEGTEPAPEGGATP